MRLALIAIAVVLTALAGCASKPAPATNTPPAAPVSGPPTPHATLASEQKRLAALFRDTPAVFVMQPDGSLRAAVPLRYCFDRGSVAIKPPLAAVLDRLAKSQLNETSLMRVAAPPDPGVASPTLIRDRTASVRDRLVAQGIAAARVTLVGAAQVEGVEVFVVEPAPR